MRTTNDSPRMLLGCAGLAMLWCAMPQLALAASCGKVPYAPGLHVLAAPAHASAAVGVSSGRTAPSNDDHQDFDQGSIVGLWHTIYISGGKTAFESFEQWHQDGNEFEASDLQLGSMCQGTWVQVADRTFRLFHIGWNFDSTGVTLTGYFTETQTVTLAEDAKTYDGTFAITNFDTSGNHTPAVAAMDMSGNVHSTRLTVQ